jgi:hypothetical protein
MSRLIFAPDRGWTALVVLKDPLFVIFGKVERGQLLQIRDDCTSVSELPGGFSISEA